jgi:hypothetical protein
MFPWRTTVAAILGSLVFLLAAVGGSGVADVTAQSGPTRSQVSKAILGARDYARSLDDVFGGVWITDEGAVFAFTDRATDAQVADILAHLASWVPYTTTSVESSEAELNAVADRVLEDVKAGELPYLRSIEVDIQGNAVVIGIMPAQSCARQAELQQRYGEVRLVFRATEGDVGTPDVSQGPATTATATGAPTPSATPCPALASPAASPSSVPCPGPVASPETSPQGLLPSPSIDPCVSPSDPASPDVPVAPTERWGPMAIADADGVATPDVGLGPVRLVIGERCVMIQSLDDPHDGRETLVFRKGQVTWDAEGKRIHFRNKVDGPVWLHDGDVLTMGAWDPWSESSPGEVLPEWAVRPDPDCPAKLDLVHEVSMAR